MKEEALKLAKYLDRLNGYMNMPRDILDITQPSSAMIRRLVEELDKKPLSEVELKKLMEVLPMIINTLTDDDLIQFARAIEEIHGIK